MPGASNSYARKLGLERSKFVERRPAGNFPGGMIVNYKPKTINPIDRKGIRMPTIAKSKLAGSMKFIARTGSGHEVTMDATPKGGGEDTAPRPAELPFVGLSGCTGMDVISILRKMRQDVTSFEVEVEGLERREEYPKHWTEIRVIFHVEGEVDGEKLARAIDLSRTRYCGVSALMKETVRIHYSYVLNGETTDMPDSD